MPRVLMKSLRDARSYESLVLRQNDMTISEAMDPENWPPAKSVSSKPMALNTLVTVFASDGGAQCYVADLDDLGRPVLALFRTTMPTVPNTRRARATADLLE